MIVERRGRLAEMAWPLRGPASDDCDDRDPARGDPRITRTAVFAVGCLWYLYAMLHNAGHPRGGAFGWELLVASVVVAVGGLLLGLVLYRHAPSYAGLAGLACSAAGVVTYAVAPTSRPGSTVLFAICGIAAARYPIRWAALIAAVASTGIFAVVTLQDRPSGELWTIVGLLGMSAGIRAGRLRDAARRTRQQNLVLAERAHIAREIHDILAHSLSAQLVHLEGARLLIVGGRNEEALERVERARGLARSGLEETRRALATLRGDVPPLDEVLRDLADEHRALDDARCDVTIEGDFTDLPAKAALAVVRTAQEALTNVRKHAPGADVEIHLGARGGWCELVMTDSGRRDAAAPLAEMGGGYGLVGMRERAELIGGSLDAGPGGKGFRVLLKVPL